MRCRYKKVSKILRCVSDFALFFFFFFFFFFLIFFFRLMFDALSVFAVVSVSVVALVSVVVTTSLVASVVATILSMRRALLVSATLSRELFAIDENSLNSYVRRLVFLKSFFLEDLDLASSVDRRFVSLSAARFSSSSFSLSSDLSDEIETLKSQIRFLVSRIQIIANVVAKMREIRDRFDQNNQSIL